MNERLHSGEHSFTEIGEEAARRSVENKKNNENKYLRDQKEEERLARKEATEVAQEARSYQEQKRPEKTQKKDLEPPINSKQREQSFKQTMSHVQTQLSPTDKTFSKIIHAKTIERASETVANTIARPNAILAGSIFAFLTVTALYFMAKYSGFSLSGFETIGAFLVGWLVGVLFDLIKGLFKR